MRGRFTSDPARRRKAVCSEAPLMPADGGPRQQVVYKCLDDPSSRPDDRAYPAQKANLASQDCIAGSGAFGERRKL